MNDFINNLLKGKNVNPIIVIAAIVAVLIFRSCEGGESGSDQNPDVISVSQDTTFKNDSEFPLVRVDTFLKEVPVPVPEFIVQEVHDTIIETIIKEVHDTVYTERIVYVPRADSLFAYDSVYVAENYALHYHIESLGRLRAFKHRIEFPDTAIERITITEKVQGENRGWLLLAEGAGLSDFRNLNETEFYAGGSLLRTKKNITFGAGYLNQVGGKNHIISAKFGIRF